MELAVASPVEVNQILAHLRKSVILGLGRLPTEHGRILRRAGPMVLRQDLPQMVWSWLGL